jgi:hypothetical protein
VAGGRKLPDGFEVFNFDINLSKLTAPKRNYALTAFIARVLISLIASVKITNLNG